MIVRIWNGWTTFENADVYEQLLKEYVFPRIEAKKVAGYRKIQLLRRRLENEVEFTTIMWFDSWDAVKEFAGEDYQKSYVPDKAHDVLSRFSDVARHYELRETLEY